jgi:sec-independent protein translocase protein TatB
MFDIGFWELIILFGLGLIILGPERLPKVAIQLGQWAGQARRMARSLTTQIRDELDVDLNQPFDADFTRPKSSAQNYKRPGVDDLNPSMSEEKQPDADTDAHADTDADADASKE